MKDLRKPGTTGGPPPAYAQKLNEWNDKEVQKQQITQEQQILQDEIAVETDLQPGEQATITYLDIGYVVTGAVRLSSDGVGIQTCTIIAKPIDVVIA